MPTYHLSFNHSVTFGFQKLLTVICILCFWLMTESAANAAGQKNSASNSSGTSAGTPQSTSGSPSSGSNSGLTGISFARSSWDETLVMQDAKTLGLRHDEDLVAACYKLVVGRSAAQPFVLEPIPVPAPWMADSNYINGQTVHPTSPNGHYYSAKVPALSAEDPFTFNIGTDTEDAEGLVWQDMGPVSGLSNASPWQANHRYFDGDRVTPNPPNPSNKHFYRAVVSLKGASGKNEPAWKTKDDTADPGGTITWADLGVGFANPNIHANCTNITPSNPLLMDQILVIAIDTSDIPDEIADRFKILNLNITNQQGQSLNPTPIRPSATAGSASGPETAANVFGLIEGPRRRFHDAYYITWPNQLPGDTIPTVSVNVVYTPVAPGLPWQRNTLYPAGSIVLPMDTSNTNGHYYIATNSGVSSNLAPVFAEHVLTTATATEGTGLSWKDMGLTPPTTSPGSWIANRLYDQGELVIPPMNLVNGHYYRVERPGRSDPANPPMFVTNGQTSADGPNLAWRDMGLLNLFPAPGQWVSNSGYAVGAQVVPNPANGHYYQAVTAGVSEPNAPAFPVDGSTVAESTGVVYIDAGTALPANAKIKAWQSNTAFFLADAILDQKTGHYFTVVQPGISGAAQPSFQVTPLEIGVVPGSTVGQEIIWQDIGPTLPSSVTAGIPSTDLTVNLLNYTFPQVHALSRLNFATGAVVSSILSPSFVNLGPTTTSTGATIQNWNTVKSGVNVDPIVAVTVYIKPIDAERPYQWADSIPMPSVAFSMASPTNNFYVGASSELFIRNIQAIYGFALSRVSVLQAPANQTNTMTAATRMRLAKGAFVGVTFNITGFITSLTH